MAVLWFCLIAFLSPRSWAHKIGFWWFSWWLSIFERKKTKQFYFKNKWKTMIEKCDQTSKLWSKSSDWILRKILQPLSSILLLITQLLLFPYYSLPTSVPKLKKSCWHLASYTVILTLKAFYLNWKVDLLSKKNCVTETVFLPSSPADWSLLPCFYNTSALFIVVWHTYKSWYKNCYHYHIISCHIFTA